MVATPRRNSDRGAAEAKATPGAVGGAGVVREVGDGGVARDEVVAMVPPSVVVAISWPSVVSALSLRAPAAGRPEEGPAAGPCERRREAAGRQLIAATTNGCTIATTSARVSGSSNASCTPLAPPSAPAIPVKSTPPWLVFPSGVPPP